MSLTYETGMKKIMSFIRHYFMMIRKDNIHKKTSKHPVSHDANIQSRTFPSHPYDAAVTILFSKQIQSKAHLSHGEDTIHRLMLRVHTF